MSITKELKQIKDNYESSTIDIVDGLPYSQYETLRKVEFYTNSRYLNGNTDLRNRVKPFYNIINFRVNVAVRATDFDTKDFQVYSENPKHYIKSMMFSKEMKNWMKRVNFAQTLNEAGQVRPKYGGVIIKRVKRNGELFIQVPEWKNLITDPVDIENGVIAERHYMTPVQIQSKMGVWSGLEDSYEDIEKVFKKQHGKNYSTSDRVCVLEVEGEFEREYVTESGTDSDEKYALQRHFILLDGDDVPTVCLHSEFKKDRDYKYLPWMKTSGRALGIGIAEDGFEAQYSVNDTLLKENDIMEIAARTVFWTDAQTIENNLLEDLETGDILKVQTGETMQVLNSTPSSLPQLDNIRQKWDEQYSRATSTFEAITGETMPSSTPFRSVAIQNQESTAMFQYRMEEAGIFWRQVFSEWIVPHLKAKLSREHILASDYTAEELQVIDEALATETANKKVISRAISGKVTTKDEYNSLLEAEKEILRMSKSQRFLTIPKDYFKDLEAQIDINITGEQLNKGVLFESINNMIVTVSNSFNPETGTFAVLEDPTLSRLFGKAVELADVGISPAELIAKKPKVNQMQMPAQEQQPIEAQPEPVTA